MGGGQSKQDSVNVEKANGCEAGVLQAAPSPLLG